MIAQAEELLDFWFGELDADGAAPPDRRQRWFRPPVGFDQELERRFGGLVQDALDARLDAWTREHRGALALVLLLDQLTRNVHRGRAKAFAGDARAREIVLEAVESREDRKLAPVERSFLYMPLMHAEDATLQRRSVGLYAALAEDAPAALVESLRANHDFAVSHREVIPRFGRFPGRNEALGRVSTPEELRYLEEGGGF